MRISADPPTGPLVFERRPIYQPGPNDRITKRPTEWEETVNSQSNLFA